MTVRLLFISIVPSIILAFWIYFHDRYDREPITLVLKTFIYGALIIIPTLFLE